MPRCGVTHGEPCEVLGLMPLFMNMHICLATIGTFLQHSISVLRPM